MRNSITLIPFFLLAVILNPGPALSGERLKWHPGHYVLPLDQSLLTMNEDPRQEAAFEKLVASLPREISGVQGGAYWSQLEPQKGVYDLGLIEKQLAVCAKYKKYFFCTISEKVFNDARSPVPAYIITDPAYKGGILPFKNGGGAQARIWVPAVLDRYDLLLAELGRRFDREPYFEGIEFVETALDIDPGQAGLTPESYLQALKTRMLAARKAFPSSVVLQETNWLIGGERAMADFVDFCCRNGMGIGGPDLIPDAERSPRRPRIPAYKYFAEYSGKMPLASDVQSPEYLGRSGSKVIGALTAGGVYDMGVNTLKLNYIFWGICDWANTRFTFSRDVLPLIKRLKGKINSECPANRQQPKGKD